MLMIFIRNIQIVSSLILFFAIICDQRYLLGNDQQVVIHWTTETDLNSSILLKDRDGNHIDSGTSSNGDGCLATLGYFSWEHLRIRLMEIGSPLLLALVLETLAVVMDLLMEPLASQLFLPRIPMP